MVLEDTSWIQIWVYKEEHRHMLAVDQSRIAYKSLRSGSMRTRRPYAVSPSVLVAVILALVGMTTFSLDLCSRSLAELIYGTTV